MSDEENSQPIPEPEASPENPISEPDPIPESPQEPIPDVSIPQVDSIPSEVPSEASQASPNPEEAIPVNNNIPANEPLVSAPDTAEALPGKQDKPSEPAPEPLEQPNINVEKHGNDVTITEVMQPKAETAQMTQPSSETTTGKQETAHLPPIEPLDNDQTKKMKENLKLANQTRQEKKRAKIDKIISLFSKNPKITNDDVEKLLHVSDATATRYLETLEKEGKIRQVGKTGKGVVYEKIK